MGRKSLAWASKQISPVAKAQPRTPATFAMDSSEVVLPDDHPVYADYFYICDGTVTRSHIRGDVARLKASGGFKTIRNFAVFAREGVRIGDRICGDEVARQVGFGTT